jgi:hypothetical protein
VGREVHASRGLLQSQAGDDPLLYPERQDYLRAVRGVIANLETARVVLARAKHRLTGQR